MLDLGTTSLLTALRTSHLSADAQQVLWQRVRSALRYLACDRLRNKLLVKVLVRDNGTGAVVEEWRWPRWTLGWLRPEWDGCEDVPEGWEGDVEELRTDEVGVRARTPDIGWDEEVRGRGRRASLREDEREDERERYQRSVSEGESPPRDGYRDRRRSHNFSWQRQNSPRPQASPSFHRPRYPTPLTETQRINIRIRQLPDPPSSEPSTYRRTPSPPPRQTFTNLAHLPHSSQTVQYPSATGQALYPNLPPPPAESSALDDATTSLQLAILEMRYWTEAEEAAALGDGETAHERACAAKVAGSRREEMAKRAVSSVEASRGTMAPIWRLLLKMRT